MAIDLNRHSVLKNWKNACSVISMISASAATATYCGNLPQKLIDPFVQMSHIQAEKCGNPD